MTELSEPEPTKQTAFRVREAARLRDSISCADCRTDLRRTINVWMGTRLQGVSKKMKPGPNSAEAADDLVDDARNKHKHQ